MRLDNVNLFKGYNALLDGLSDSVKSRLYGLIFTYRDGAESVAIVFTDKSIFAEVAGGVNVPDGFLYALDLESIGTDKLRAWVDKRDPDICLFGYYLNADGVYETKHYKFAAGSTDLEIDRFDVNMNLISADEPELVGTKADWKGNQSIISTIEDNGFRARYMKKGLKDQSYVYVKVGGN